MGDAGNTAANDNDSSPLLPSSAPAPQDPSVGGDDAGAPGRRQRRLERNRESARLSRRRRKHYLEVLEEKVTFLSEEMDRGRREHASRALGTVRQKRLERLKELERDLGLDFFSALGPSNHQQLAPPPWPINAEVLQHHLNDLDTRLSRTSKELRVAGTFHKQQLLSLCLPEHRKFILWLTVQNDALYRGGRAASERLSAARIGERMYQSGNDRAPPSGDMWPLLCNDVGLSYDQEEKLRAYQRIIVMEKETWLDRHTAAAADASVEVACKAMSAIMGMANQREHAVLDMLTAEQKGKFMIWAAARKEKIERVSRRILARQKNTFSSEPTDTVIKTSPDRCDAANLYIIHDRLQKLCQQVPSFPHLVSQSYLKKLSRRASFESLVSLESAGKNAMSREKSFPSTGSLKRAASDISMDELAAAAKQKEGSITPAAGQAAAAQHVASALMTVTHIIPTSPPREYTSVARPKARDSNLERNAAYNQYQQVRSAQGQMQQPSYAHFVPQFLPASYHSTAATVPAPTSPQGGIGLPIESPSPTPIDVMSSPIPVGNHSGMQYPQVEHQHPPETRPIQPSDSFVESNHGRIPSVLPDHMNIMLEEGLIHNGQAADAFLFDLAELDWAIGEGLDMDM